MLGGLCELDPLDIRDSELLLKKLFQKHQMGSENVSELGAGIGRVSQHLFRKHFGKVFFSHSEYDTNLFKSNNFFNTNF